MAPGAARWVTALRLGQVVGHHALELLAKHFALLTEVSELLVSGLLTVERVGRMSDEELAARLRESLAQIDEAKSTARPTTSTEGE